MLFLVCLQYRHYVCDLMISIRKRTHPVSTSLICSFFSLQHWDQPRSQVLAVKIEASLIKIRQVAVSDLHAPAVSGMAINAYNISKQLISKMETITCEFFQVGLNLTLSRYSSIFTMSSTGNYLKNICHDYT